MIEQEYNPLFDLLGQLLTAAMHDNVFEAEIEDVEQIYTATFPGHKRCMQLKIKGDKLDLPIFREPIRSEEGYRTSKEQPLKARRWRRYLRRLGFKGGLEEDLGQKHLRRGAINSNNSMSLSSCLRQSFLPMANLTPPSRKCTGVHSGSSF